MKIIFLSQWYPPEQAPFGHLIQELANFLSERGHTVTVITGYPNHPSGLLFPGYKKKLISRLKTNRGVSLIRSWLYTTSDRSIPKRIANFFTFNITSHIALALEKKADVIFTTPQPLSVAATLPLITSQSGAKLVFSLQDLHPNAAISLNLIKNRFIILVLEMVEKMAYRIPNAVLPICDSFRDHCIQKGADKYSTVVIHNWIDECAIRPLPTSESLRHKFGLKSEHFVLLYAGTTSKASGVEYLLDIAPYLTNSKIVIVGEGSELAKLKELAANRNQDNVHFFPFQQRSEISLVQAISDISLLPINDTSSSNSVPSKLLGYMAAGRPVACLGPKNSEVAKIIEKHQCGIVLTSKDPSIDAIAIQKLRENRELRERLGQNARITIEKEFGKTNTLLKISKLLKQVATKHQTI